MNLNTLYKKALNLEPLSADEGSFLFRNSPPAELFVNSSASKIHSCA